MAASYFDDDDDVVLGRDDDEGSDEGMASARGPEGPRGAQGKADGKAQDGQAQPSKKRPVQPPRPKLTLEKLQEEHGFNHVFHKFPEVFRTGFKGKGHEVADLQRLLEMYSRWQQRIFPHCTFDNFIFKIEKFSSNRLLKNELEQLRLKLLILLDPEGQDMDQRQHREGLDGNQGLGLTATQRIMAMPALAGGRATMGLTQPQTASQTTAVAPERASGAAQQGGGAWRAPQAAAIGAGRHAAGAGPERVGSGSGQAARAGAVPVAGGRGPAPVEEMEDEFDDELLAMQANSHWDAGMDVLDDLEMMDQRPAPPRPLVRNAGAAATSTAATTAKTGSVAVQPPDVTKRVGRNANHENGDEELLAMLEDDMEPRENAARKDVAPPAARASATQDEDAELLAMLEDNVQPSRQAEGQSDARSQARMGAEDEDEGLLAMLEEGVEGGTQGPVGQGGERAGAWQAPAGASLRDDSRQAADAVENDSGVGSMEAETATERETQPAVVALQATGSALDEDGLEGQGSLQAKVTRMPPPSSAAEWNMLEDEQEAGPLAGTASQVVRARCVRAVLDDDDD